MNTDPLPRELYVQTRDFITQFLSDDPRTRKTVVQDALYGVSLSESLQWEDTHAVFVPNLIGLALTYGTLPGGTPALCEVITTIGKTKGENRQEEAAELCRAIVALDKSGASVPDTTASAPDTTQWHIPDPSAGFVGRESELQAVRDAFQIKSRVALIGIAGAGKTQIARAYAASVRKRFARGFEIVAESSDTLAAGLADIARVVYPDRSYQNDAARALADAQTFLKTAADTLLVVDNVDDAAIWGQFPWDTWHAHILVTGRDGNAAFGMEPVSVETVTPGEGARLLCAYVAPALVKSTPQTLWEEISTELDGLPLALVQAGRYIAETGTPPASYLAEIRRDMARYMALSGDSDRLKRGNVAATVDKARQRLHSINPAHAELLTWCAYLAPDAIPDRIFRQQAVWDGHRWQVISPALLECVRDDAAWNRAVAALDRLGLLTGRDPGVSFSLHRTTQAALRALAYHAGGGKDADAVCALVCAAYNYNATDKWDYMAVMLPQLLHATDAAHDGGYDTYNAACAANRAADILLDRGEYAWAAALYERAAGIVAALPGADGTDAAAVQYNRAQTYTLAEQHDEAAALLEQVLAFREKHLGKTHLHTGSTLHALAAAHQSAGRSDKAEPLYRRSLAVWEANGATETRGYAATLQGLAMVLQRTGRREEAQGLYEQSLAITERVQGKGHPDTAAVLYNLAGFHHDGGNPQAARPLYVQALAIWQKHLPKNHPHRLWSEQEYARCLRDLDMEEPPGAL